MRRRILLLCFFATLAALLGVFALRSAPVLGALKPDRLMLLIPFALLVGAQSLLSAWSNRLLYGPFMEGNTLLNNLRLSLVTALGNLLPVSAGVLSRGVYAKRVNGLPYLAFAVLTGYQVGAALLFAGLSCLILPLFVPLRVLYLLAPALIIPTLVLQADLYRFFPARMRAALSPEQYVQLRKVGRAQYPVQLGLQALTQAVSALKLYLVFQALGAVATPGQAFLIYTAVNLARYASFTPGGLGLPEGVGGSLSAWLGIPFALSFLVISVDRILELAFSFLLIPLLFSRRPAPGVHGAA